MRKRNILVVDSDIKLNRLNKKVLLSSGIVNDLYMANNGADALIFLESCVVNRQPLPDIIVFDLHMRGLNGFDFIDGLINLDIPARENVELVVFTASSNPRDQKKAIMKEIRHYVSKPYLLRGLREVYSKIISGECRKQRYSGTIL